MLKIIRRFRWHILAIAIVVLWAMGFASLSFVMPEMPSDNNGSAETVDALEMEAQDTFNKTGHSSSSKIAGEQSSEETIMNNGQNQSLLGRCSIETKNEIIAQRNTALEQERERYEQEKSDLHDKFDVLSLISSTKQLLSEALASLAALHEENVAEIKLHYRQKLSDAGCNP